jgi:Tol biopolymer transport system component
VIVCAVSASALASLTVEALAQSHGGSSRLIVFVRGAPGLVPSGPADLWLMRADGNGQRRRLKGFALNPVWSPDGRRIVFNTISSGPPAIQVLTLAGGKPRTLISDRLGNFDFPAWSPDGGRIAFDYEHPLGEEAVYVMSADGTGVRALTRPSNRLVDGVAWSPNGREILYVQSPRARNQTSPISSSDLYSIRPDGTGRTRLVHVSDGQMVQVAWSADGLRLLTTIFYNRKSHPSGIYSFAANGTKPRLLVRGDRVRDPSWTADGKGICSTSRSGRTRPPSLS